MKTKLTEILRGKSLGDDVIQAILDEMKAQGVHLTAEENMDVRYPKLKTQYEGATKSLDEANATIKQLQEAAQGQENLQQIIKDHEQKEAQLQAELDKAKFEAEAKYGLYSAGAEDVDYGLYMLQKIMMEDGKEMKVDENGKIPGWEDLLSSLKTQSPKNFPAKADGDGYEVYEPLKLKKGDGKDAAPTKEEFRAMTYEERLALKQKNENLYKQLAK